MDKQNVAFIHNGITFSHKKERICFFKEIRSHSVTQDGVQWHDYGSLQPRTGLKPFSCLSFLGSWDYRHMSQCLTNVFLIFFLVEKRSCHVAQAGLELLASSSPPVLASTSNEIIGLSHHPPPALALLIQCSTYLKIYKTVIVLPGPVFQYCFQSVKFLRHFIGVT